MRPTLGASQLPRGVHPILVVWLFVAIVILLAGLTVYSSHLQSGARALVGSGGEWAKAQKDAAYFLSRFASGGAEEDFLAYERAMANVDAARGARLDFPFLGVGPVRRVGELSAQGDRLAEQMRGIARALRAGTPTPDAAGEVHRINLRLAPLVDEIRGELDAIASGGQALITSGILIITGILLIAGITLSRRFLAQNERLQQTLAESETQLRHLVEAAPLPLLLVRATDQQLLYANERALEQFALNVDTALTHALGEFHVDPESRARLATAISRDGSVRDFEVHLRSASGKTFWLLLSAQPMRYAGVVCLLVALADIDERKRLQDDMRRRAMHDPLTGLPNRAMFMESLERAAHKARRRFARFSVLFIDLDHFKEVNDTMGHPAGDALLQEVGRRLTAAVRSSDMVARLAGDEFVVLVEEHGGPEEVMIVAQKALVALQAPIVIDWREAKVSASIGIASFPEDGADVPELVKNADAAMYQAKELGRNSFRFYSAERNALSQRRFDQEKRIHGALERGEFFLEYQLEFDVATGKPAAAEALLRWREPEAGVLAAAQFLPLAEETGTIAAIGAWVLDRALTDVRAWRDAGLDLKVAVNLSARELQQPELVDEVARLLAAHGVAPACLRLEVKEADLLQGSDAVQGAVRVFAARGVGIAIDNFGTGYSALGLVRGLPVQLVKIDRTLVGSSIAQRESAAIVQAAAAMARVLGIRVSLRASRPRSSARPCGSSAATASRDSSWDGPPTRPPSPRWQWPGVRPTILRHVRDPLVPDPRHLVRDVGAGRLRIAPHEPAIATIDARLDLRLRRAAGGLGHLLRDVRPAPPPAPQTPLRRGARPGGRRVAAPSFDRVRETPHARTRRTGPRRRRQAPRAGRADLRHVGKAPRRRRPEDGGARARDPRGAAPHPHRVLHLGARSRRRPLPRPPGRRGRARGRGARAL